LSRLILSGDPGVDRCRVDVSRCNSDTTSDRSPRSSFIKETSISTGLEVYELNRGMNAAKTYVIDGEHVPFEQFLLETDVKLHRVWDLIVTAVYSFALAKFRFEFAWRGVRIEAREIRKRRLHRCIDLNKEREDLADRPPYQAAVFTLRGIRVVTSRDPGYCNGRTVWPKDWRTIRECGRGDA